jgi:hypothetical protein
MKSQTPKNAAKQPPAKQTDETARQLSRKTPTSGTNTPWKRIEEKLM